MTIFHLDRLAFRDTIRALKWENPSLRGEESRIANLAFVVEVTLQPQKPCISCLALVVLPQRVGRGERSKILKRKEAIMTVRWVLGVVAVAAVGCFALQAGAVGTYGTVTASFVNDSPAIVGSIMVPTPPGQTTPGMIDVQIGMSNLKVTGTSITDAQLQETLPNATYGLPVWCIDTSHWADTTTRTYDVVNLKDAPFGNAMGVARETRLEKLFGRLQPVDTTDANSAAAFSLAVWEIVDEAKGNPLEVNALNADHTTVNASRGAFYATGVDQGVIDKANALLSGLDEERNLAQVYALYTADGSQNWALMASSTGGQPPVPEPITFLSGLMVVSGLGVYIRRKNRAAVTA